MRDTLYDRRFELARRGDGDGRGPWSGSGGGRQAPLYINECLTPANRDIYNTLLEARKARGGARVATVFSRRGVVYCRRERDGPNIRVPDHAALKKILKTDADRSAARDGGARRPAAPGRREAPEPGAAAPAPGGLAGPGLMEVTAVPLTPPSLGCSSSAPEKGQEPAGGAGPSQEPGQRRSERRGSAGGGAGRAAQSQAASSQPGPGSDGGDEAGAGRAASGGRPEPTDQVEQQLL